MNWTPRWGVGVDVAKRRMAQAFGRREVMSDGWGVTLHFAQKLDYPCGDLTAGKKGQYNKIQARGDEEEE